MTARYRVFRNEFSPESGLTQAYLSKHPLRVQRAVERLQDAYIEMLEAKLAGSEVDGIRYGTGVDAVVVLWDTQRVWSYRAVPSLEKAH